MSGRQPFLRLRNTIIIALSISLTNLAIAVGLGPIQVNSYIGQPLNASIKVTGLTASAAERTTVKLASVADYQSRGIEKLASHDRLQFNIVRSGNGHVINVRSSAGIREPFVNFLLTMDSGGASLTREYAVFLNPDPAQTAGITANPAPELAPATTPVSSPVLTISKPPAITLDKPEVPSQVSQPITEKSKQQQPQIAQTKLEKPSQPVTVSLQPASTTTLGWGGGKLEGAVLVPLTASSKVSPTTNQKSDDSSRTYHSSRMYGPVKPGETLYSIALNTRPNESVSVNKMMRAIYRANRSAFSSRNMDSLMAGYQLSIPDLNTVNATKAVVAKPSNTNTKIAKPVSNNEKEMAAVSSLSESRNKEDLLPDDLAENSDSQALAKDALEEIGDDNEIDKELNDQLAQDEMTTDEIATNAAATVDIARSNMNTDSTTQPEQINNKFDDNNLNATPELEHKQELLSSDLTLDSADSLTLSEQNNTNEQVESGQVESGQESGTELMLSHAHSQPTNLSELDQDLSSTSTVEQAANESENASLSDKQKNDQSEIALVDSEKDLQSADNPTIVASDTAKKSATNPTIFSPLRIGLLVVLLSLLTFLIYYFIKRREKPEQEMSDEQIEDMLASLEDDENLKKSLSFDDLTEDLTIDEQLEDISDTYQTTGDVEQAPKFNQNTEEHYLAQGPFDTDEAVDDDFEKLAKEAAKLGKLNEDESFTTYLNETKQEDNLSASSDSDSQSTTQIDDTTQSMQQHVSSQIEKDFFDTVEDENIAGASDSLSVDDDEIDWFTTERNSSRQSVEESQESMLEDFDFDLTEDTDTNDEQVSHHNAVFSRGESSENLPQGGKQKYTQTDDEMIEAMEINLDLANAFIVTGNGERARVWLNEVMEQGAEEQKVKAQAMLNQIDQ